ncbi:hypothetical protein DYB31_000100 [Aphanomyces astaci]|uniref:GYF domain-containing protein n=2 Tax=Aphanomyces astaci TaxID=112090 RepID=A0A397EBS1_APHAT|nr:hypothetical protein DYB31_000100 [Aphanomyces astaci]
MVKAVNHKKSQKEHSAKFKLDSSTYTKIDKREPTIRMDMDDQELLQQSMQQGLNGEEAQEHSDLNLRPKTMFDVKGRARPSETANDNYLPQWSKDGEGFKKQYSLAEDRDRRKNKDQFADSVEEDDEPPMWDMPASEPVAADLSSWSTFNDHQPPPHVTPVPVDAWFYLDPQGLQQGPFKSAEMREWFEAGMMGGLGMYAAGPPTQAPKPVTTEYAAPSWDEDTTGSSLWNSSVKNDPELLGGAWDKPADEEPSAAASWGGADSSGWSKEKQQQPTTPVVSWNKPQESDGWGGPEPAAPQASPKSSWSKPDVVPQLGSWGRQTSEADVPDVVKEADSTWEATTPNTPSLKQIQQEEQESMRRRLKPSSSSSSSSSSSQQPPPSPTPDQQPHLEDMGQQLKRMLGVSNPSPSKSWGSKTAAAAATPPAPVTRSLSLREIQAEEERLAQLKRQEKPVVSSSRWSSVVTGMPPPYSSARPAPVEVKATPPKDRDASFWNFDASAATAASPSSHTPAYNNGSDDLVAWSSKQVKKLGGTEDLTLIQYCATLEDPGEIREYLAAYLGSTPKVSAFATEFIQKKKKHVAGKKQSAADAKATSQQKKKPHH